MDFFSDSSLIFVPTEEEKSTRESPTPTKEVPKVWQSGSTDIRYWKSEKQLAKQRKKMGRYNAEEKESGYKAMEIAKDQNADAM